MKKYILFLLLLPLFIFSQDNTQYDRVISISQFAKELKDAAKKGVSYKIENAKITYDINLDKEYLIYYDEDKEFSGDAIIKDIHYQDLDSVYVEIINCDFGANFDYPGVIFKGSTLNLYWSSRTTSLELDSILSNNVSFESDSLSRQASIRINSSTIDLLEADKMEYL